MKLPPKKHEPATENPEARALTPSAKYIAIKHALVKANVTQETKTDDENKIAAIDSRVPDATADYTGTDSTHIAAFEYSPQEIGIWQVTKPPIVSGLEIINDQRNVAHFVITQAEGCVAVPVSSSFGRDIIRAQAKKKGIRLKQREVIEVQE